MCTENERFSDPGTAWSQAIRFSPREFLDFFYRDISENIDYSCPIRFLDDIKDKVSAGIKVSGTAADLLMEVRITDEHRPIRHLHIFIVEENHVDFTDTMKKYLLKIASEIGEVPVPLLLLIDDETFCPSYIEL